MTRYDKNIYAMPFSKKKLKNMTQKNRTKPSLIIGTELKHIDSIHDLSVRFSSDRFWFLKSSNILF